MLDEVLLKWGRTSSTQFQVHQVRVPNLSLQGEVYSNMNMGAFELTLQKLHTADKFSGAKLARQRRTCPQSAPNAVSTPHVNKEVAKYPDAKIARQGVLGLPLS